MIRGYILGREQLVNVFVLVDIRHEAQAIDLEFINWLGVSSIPFAIVFTKADKLSESKVKANVNAYVQKMLETWEEMPPYFITSSEKHDGRDDVLNYIEQINKELKARVQAKETHNLEGKQWQGVPLRPSSRSGRWCCSTISVSHCRRAEGGADCQERHG